MDWNLTNQSLLVDLENICWTPRPKLLLINSFCSLQKHVWYVPKFTVRLPFRSNILNPCSQLTRLVWLSAEGGAWQVQDFLAAHLPSSSFSRIWSWPQGQPVVTCPSVLSLSDWINLNKSECVERILRNLHSSGWTWRPNVLFPTSEKMILFESKSWTFYKQK